MPSFRRSTVVPCQCKAAGMGNEIADKIPAERLRCAKRPVPLMHTVLALAHWWSMLSQGRHTRHKLGKRQPSTCFRTSRTVAGLASLNAKKVVRQKGLKHTRGSKKGKGKGREHALP